MDATEWAAFFDGHAPRYNDNCFTKNTLAEVDFLIEKLDLSPGMAILDVGCGTGRHAVELARRGYDVTGVDISSGMLDEARKAADAAGVDVTWRRADAAAFSTDRQYDAVLCLCEGAFGLLGSRDDSNEQPLAILGNVASALKPRAKCLFTVLNAFRMARLHTQPDVEQGRFDPLTLTEVSDCVSETGATPLQLRERGFVPTELLLLFAAAGLRVLHIGGGTAGNWKLRPLDLDEYEIMVVAERAKD